MTDNRADDYDAAWSPAGERIAFVSNRSGNYEMYTAGPAGGTVQARDERPGVRRDAGVVARRPPDRVRLEPVRQLRRLGDERERQRRPALDPQRARATSSRAGRPTGRGSSSRATGPGNAEIHVMNADGERRAAPHRHAPRRTSSRAGRPTAPASCSCGRLGDQELFSMSARRRGRRRASPPTPARTSIRRGPRTARGSSGRATAAGTLRPVLDATPTGPA